MIPITRDQKVAGNDNLLVYAVSGDYADKDLIECYDPSLGNYPTACFQAQFIKYGPVVYQFNEPEELGKALIEIDPQSTHDSAALYKEEEDRKRKRRLGTLEPENPAPVDSGLSKIEPQVEVPVSDVSLGDTPLPPASGATSAPETIVSDPLMSSDSMGVTTSTPERINTPQPSVGEVSSSTPEL